MDRVNKALSVWMKNKDPNAQGVRVWGYSTV
jgi:hypothetical protein